MCDAIVKSLLKFNVSQKYFGEVSSKDLNETWNIIKRSHDWDEPVYSKNIKIGYVASREIFDALWKQMSLNPVRWGTENPFGDKGIIHFCKNIDVPSSELLKIKDHLYSFLDLNALPNGQWSDNLETCNGFVEIGMNAEGHTNNNYKKVRTLLNCIKEITQQNISDFIVKRSPHRNEIIVQLADRFPKQVRIKDFDLMPDLPAGTMLDLFERPRFITKKEWRDKYR